MNFSTILMILLIAEVTNAANTVQTSNGLVVGTNLASGKVESFLGVPYAEPPVGSLRFVKPVPKSPWQDVCHANQLLPSCIQTKIFEVFTADLSNITAERNSTSQLEHSIQFLPIVNLSDDTAPVAATPAAATPKKKAKSAAKKPKTVPSRPKVSEMVNYAIQTLKERGGSSLQAIKKHIGAHHKVDMDRLTPHIKKYLKSAVASGTLIQTKGKGAGGSLKLSASGQKTKEPSKAKKEGASLVKKPKTAAKKTAKQKPKTAAKEPAKQKPKTAAKEPAKQKPKTAAKKPAKQKPKTAATKTAKQKPKTAAPKTAKQKSKTAEKKKPAAKKPAAKKPLSPKPRRKLQKPRKRRF